MILLVFDLEVRTVKNSMHRQNNGNFLSCASFLVYGCSWLADTYAGIGYLTQSDKSSLHILVIRCFISYHKMNHSYQEREQIVRNEISPLLIGIMGSRNCDFR